MKLKIREGIINDYIEIRNMFIEVHNLHVRNRPDVYLDVENPFEEEFFKELLESENTRVLVVENEDNKELLAFL